MKHPVKEMFNTTQQYILKKLRSLQQKDDELQNSITELNTNFNHDGNNNDANFYSYTNLSSGIQASNGSNRGRLQVHTDGRIESYYSNDGGNNWSLNGKIITDSELNGNINPIKLKLESMDSTSIDIDLIADYIGLGQWSFTRKGNIVRLFLVFNTKSYVQQNYHIVHFNMPTIANQYCTGMTTQGNTTLYFDENAYLRTAFGLQANMDFTVDTTVILK